MMWAPLFLLGSIYCSQHSGQPVVLFVRHSMKPGDSVYASSSSPTPWRIYDAYGVYALKVDSIDLPCHRQLHLYVM